MALRSRAHELFIESRNAAGTALELLGQPAPSGWDGVSFARSLLAGTDEGRGHLVVSQGAWTCQRGVRFDRWMLIRSLHDSYHLFDDTLLFQLETDLHEQNNLAASRPDIVEAGMKLLSA